MLPRTAFVFVIFGLATFMLYNPSEQEGFHELKLRRLLAEENSEDITDNQTNQNDQIDQNTNISANDPSAKKDPLFPDDAFSEQQLKHGAVVLHIIGIVYMFYALALVCDEFFVPSLDVIIEKLEITPDVAGATFMAAGGSAPELFTSVIGVFIAQNDVGIGTIVGSAVFNILFVIAACAFAAKSALELTAWPLIRDVFFYSVSLVVLVVFFIDEKIEWWEALILFLWYFAYVGFMKINEATEDKLRQLFNLPAVNRANMERGVTFRNAKNRKGLFALMNETVNPGILSIMIGHQQGITGLKSTLEPPGSEAEAGNDPEAAAVAQENGKEMEEVVKQTETITEEPVANEANAGDVAKKDENNEETAEEDAEDPIDMTFPRKEGWKKILIYLISFPIMAPLYITLPDTRDKTKKKFFVITFLGSIIWIAAYSYLMVWWATVAGNTIGIPEAVMGLTFLAAGTSVPDLITSVLVAKQGKGDMAVSSSVGSNIFDVCVGLPFPWLLYTLIRQEPVSVSSAGMGCNVLMLFMMLVAVFLSIVIFKWKMTKVMGIIMGLLYVVFVLISLGFSYGLYECFI